MRATAIYACQADNTGEVSFAANETLTDVRYSSEDGWLVGTVQSTGRRGLFPAVYTQLAAESGDDAALLRRLQSDGLLSSVAQMDAVRRDLDAGRGLAIHSYSSSSSVQRSETVYSTSADGRPVHSYAATAAESSMTATASSSSSSSSQAAALRPALPVKEYQPLPLRDQPRLTIRSESPPSPVAAPKPAVARKPAVASKPAVAPKPAVATKPAVASKSAAEISAESERHAREREEAASWEARHLTKAGGRPSGTTLVPRPKPAVAAAKPAVAAKLPPPKPAKSTTDINAEAERHERERAEAASWEARHLAKSSSIETSRDVSRLLGAATSPASRPAVPTKRAVAIPAGSGSAAAAASSSSSSSCSQTKPAVCAKPPGCGAPAAPPLLASRYGSSSIASNNSKSSSTTTTTTTAAAVLQRSNPATANDAPELPYDADRAKAAREMLEKDRPAPPTNPATANDAPALPYSAHRLAVQPVVVPVDQSKLPPSQQLIQKMNSQAPGMAAARAMMSNNNSSIATTTTTMSSSSSSLQSSSTSMAGAASAGSHYMHRSESSSTSSFNATESFAANGVPLTMARNVKGVLPFPAANQQQQSYVTKTSSYSHQESRSMVSSNNSNSNSGGGGTIPLDARQRYGQLFAQLDAEGGRRGFVSADKVRDIMARSRLDDAVLRRIWQLADRNMDGRFGPGEFNIAMHLVDSALRGAHTPDFLPIDHIHSAYA
ncbi:Intersectin 1 (SH3 domain protein) [Coemansia javaensis]|uniref:Intersectin 1 (SH3 domain protein) n=1 Tax=Coemansia javaensis TaxID=2761396 RepID=A0A9W8HFQ4_9FUNG|nr:Intersectin 1 (SH3 domain protein) [Coemansia javaensis]